MTARVLVVDDLPPNVKLLEARLNAEYFEVLTATNGPDALAICARGVCDIVLLDVMMPGMDGFEVCRRLKANPETAHLPVVMVTALDQPRDRVRGLEAGADDFLTKPIDEVALLSRVRSLARMKMSLDELRGRYNTAASLGGPNAIASPMADSGEQGRILLVDNRSSSVERITSALRGRHKLEIEGAPQQAIFRAAEEDYELFIVSLALNDFDGLRVASQLRSLERTRQTPILLLADLEDRASVLRGLELGVNDYLARPIDPNELIARVRTQVRRKRYTDALRSTLQASIELALVDMLTGLYNRRYLELNLARLLDAGAQSARPVSLMVLDIDHFKRVNDTWGHDAGDDVLRAFANRVKIAVRDRDLVCRLGGEEFIVAMPDTDLATAAAIAERVRGTIEAEPFAIDKGARYIPVTVSVGLAQSMGEIDPAGLFRRADKALYRSKSEGRNRVTYDAA
ncbi:MAG: PleD family two-component system response regulator [Hyphomicrobiales bacterium]|nr:PleD family two-component system response regulator [Hyphomicrobiales bacterium]